VHLVESKVVADSAQLADCSKKKLQVLREAILHGGPLAATGIPASNQSYRVCVYNHFGLTLGLCQERHVHLIEIMAKKFCDCNANSSIGECT
jgi:hypothetical protein